jgi:hypothetical protein
VQQWFGGQRYRHPPPHPPDELTVDAIVVDANVDLLQRHRWRRTHRSGPRQRVGVGPGQLDVAVLGPRQRDGERDACGGQQSAGLSGVHPARRRRPSVEDGFDRVLHRLACLAATQELKVHVGGQLLAIDGPSRGGQALRHELTAERSLARRTAGRAQPAVRVIPGPDVEQC